MLTEHTISPYAGKNLRFSLHSAILLLLSVCLVGCSLPGPNRASPTPPAPTRTSTFQPSPMVGRVSATPTAANTPGHDPTPSPTATPSLTPVPPVSVETLTVASQFMNGEKRIAEVYLPGEYASTPNKRYKVLYAFDGQELPLMAFEQYLNSLFSSRQVEPVIVVGVYSDNGDQRMQELGAGPYLNVFGWGVKSDAFNRFMVNELVPKVNKLYRTRTGPENTGVMGWSLGGLAAFYLGWMYPKVFGIVGSFSPSFWWRVKSDPGYELQARVVHQLVRDGAFRPGMKMWFEAGTNEEPFSDINKNNIPDVIEDIQDLVKLLQQKGYRVGVDVVYMEVQGGQHQVTTWAKLLPNFLQFAFPYGGT